MSEGVEAGRSELRPVQDGVVVNLETPRDGQEPLPGDLPRWLENRRLPAYRVPPPTTSSDGGDLWALQADVDALAAGDALDPSPREDNDLYEVYVVELRGCADHPGGCLYVGQSFRSARNRFIQHLVG